MAVSAISFQNEEENGGDFNRWWGSGHSFIIKHVSSSDEMKTLGYMFFLSSDMLTQPAQASCTEQNFLPGRCTDKSWGYYSRQKRKGCLFFLCILFWVNHPQCCVCTVWSRCLLICRTRGFCMQDYGGSCSKNSCFLNTNDAQCVLKATELPSLRRHVSCHSRTHRDSRTLAIHSRTFKAF